MACQGEVHLAVKVMDDLDPLNPWLSGRPGGHICIDPQSSYVSTAEGQLQPEHTLHCCSDICMFQPTQQQNLNGYLAVLRFLVSLEMLR